MSTLSEINMPRVTVLTPDPPKYSFYSASKALKKSGHREILLKSSTTCLSLDGIIRPRGDIAGRWKVAEFAAGFQRFADQWISTEFATRPVGSVGLQLMLAHRSETLTAMTVTTMGEDICKLAVIAVSIVKLPTAASELLDSVRLESKETYLMARLGLLLRLDRYLRILRPARNDAVGLAESLLWLDKLFSPWILAAGHGWFRQSPAAENRRQASQRDESARADRKPQSPPQSDRAETPPEASKPVKAQSWTRAQYSTVVPRRKPLLTFRLKPAWRTTCASFPPTIILPTLAFRPLALLALLLFSFTLARPALHPATMQPMDCFPLYQCALYDLIARDRSRPA
ncbi:hypothetical protein K438DRAFT_1951156 [Mycena galopus ATCC 62051]|nr:hypothetical protein K438DRAFT_1951156 [Mycena galopus ATCC 62051]